MWKRANGCGCGATSGQARVGLVGKWTAGLFLFMMVCTYACTERGACVYIYIHTNIAGLCIHRKQNVIEHTAMQCNEM